MHTRNQLRRLKSVARMTMLFCTACAVFQPLTGFSVKPPAALPQVELSLLGTYASGIFDAGGAEIVAHDPLTQRLYVVNAQEASVDVLDITNPAAPVKIATLGLLPFGGVVNSVAVHEGIVAAALEATPNRTDPGKVVFFDAALTPISSVQVGAVPDMVVFTHKGRYLLVANEGEPSGYGAGHVDPEGSVSVIDLLDGPANPVVHTADFAVFAGGVPAGVRIYGPGASIPQDLEPEYIAISPDDTTAWVTLQENNALAVIDIASASVVQILPLGLKDHSAAGNGFDASDRDSAINIANWPVKGMYEPDAVAAYQIGTDMFLLMANEGDAREWPNFREDELRAGAAAYVLDPTVFPNAATLKANRNLGRLRVSKSSGDTDGDGDFDEIHALGARSFSIRHAMTGALVYDSGDAFEQITAALHRSGDLIFNVSNNNNTFDDRSPSKGPEPEGIACGRAFQRTWAFIGLERIGGVMVYDVTNPLAPRFVEYANNRNFAGTFSFATAGDLGPEGVLFIEEGDSPNGEPLVVVGNEISGTTTIYQLNKVEN
jgi:DNA-binding beta-propeller fold protein YncE